MMLKYIVATAFIAHGLGHSLGFLAAWTALPMGFVDRPWLLPGGFTMASPVGRAFGLLWLVAMIATIGAGLGLLYGQMWWRPLALAAAVISLTAILPWWPTVAARPRVWATLFDLAVLIALAPTWGDQIVQALR
jgi:hypothetical protein